MVDPEAADPDVAQIYGIVRRFAEAIANRDEEEMLAAHPGFGGEEEWWVYGQEEWEEELGRTMNLVPRSDLIPIGSTATVVFSMTVRLTDESDSPARRTRSWTRRSFPSPCDSSGTRRVGFSGNSGSARKRLQPSAWMISRARDQTSSKASSVRVPVKVFCWLG